METVWQVSVWVFASLLIYTYIGYPFLVFLLGQGRSWVGRHFGKRASGKHKAKTDLPTLSFLIPAYNEERVIRQKIENTLDLDYPRDKLRIVVVSDGSTDQTNAMLKSYGEEEISFIPIHKRRGKVNVLNQVIPQLTGDLVVLSDASGMLAPNALKNLVKCFRNPQVGCVSGVYRFDTDDETLRSTTEKIYWRYETFLKKHESKAHSAIGAHGALYGFRRELFRPLHSRAINDDFILPMEIIRQGFRVLYEPSAIVVENETTSLQGEFQRRIRINVGNFQQLFMLKGLLSPKRGLAALEFFSHKCLRALSPFLVLFLLISTYFAPGEIYTLMLKLQVLFYLIGAIGYVQEYFGLRNRLLYLPFYFLMANLSGIFGFFRFVMGKQSILWKRV